MLSRRNLLTKLGVGAIIAPTVVASAATGLAKSIVSVEDAGVVKLLKEEKSLEGELKYYREQRAVEYKSDDKLHVGQTFTHYQPFTSGPVAVVNGDQIKINHEVSLTFKHSLNRSRKFDIHTALTAHGVCVEGLVVMTDGKLSVASELDVNTIEDSHPCMTPVLWMEELAILMKKTIGVQNVINTA